MICDCAFRRMKPLLVLVPAMLVSACSTPAPKVQLTLGTPIHDKEVPGLVDFPARLTNHSQQPIWYKGNIVAWMPYYSAYTRSSPLSRWKPLPYAMCGVGATDFEIAPSASALLVANAPLHDAGHEYRAQLSIHYKTSDGRTKWLLVRSPNTIIR